MTAVAVELLTRPPAEADVPEADTNGFDPGAVEYVADTDKLMTMCACAASSDNPY
jgi:hypothetical protein